ncbi:hypothetical protein TRFO_41903 [Tritrichomonas foetus]|uniref:Uncharacterized protein n=1 Tax=Tritrichomonas foetus TaxID=1144522 RepID=A0A1J4KYE5_9EUKA|nr:hypothetical protein TRFO_41903 [Tritrichomonas foetus]|eukprot:OHT16255.1 hypothetical protein TRFO_41903 [Tritrichomonas foetus]
MIADSQSEGSQTYPECLVHSIQQYKPDSIYTKRKDVLNIKSRLLTLVQNPEYWETLTHFLRGECSKQKYDETIDLYLTTNETRILHNDLIRSILYNAHFAAVPPPGIPMPQRKLPDHINMKTQRPQKTKVKLFCSYSASDLGHIPSIEQLSSRVGYLTTLKVDNSALALLFSELKHYIISVLQQCTEIGQNNCENSEKVIVSPSQIEYVLSANTNGLHHLKAKLAARLGHV